MGWVTVAVALELAAWEATADRVVEDRWVEAMVVAIELATKEL